MFRMGKLTSWLASRVIIFSVHMACQVIRPHFVFRFESRAWGHFVWKFTVFGSCPQKAHCFLSTLTAAEYQWDELLAFILSAQGVEAFTMWHSADLLWHQTFGVDFAERVLLCVQFVFLSPCSKWLCSWDKAKRLYWNCWAWSHFAHWHDHILLSGWEARRVDDLESGWCSTEEVTQQVLLKLPGMVRDHSEVEKPKMCGSLSSFP